MRQRPYARHPIEKLFDQLEKLPGPPWLPYLSLLIITGVSAHAIIWLRGQMTPGRLNITVFFNSAWLVEALGLCHFLYAAAGPLLDGYRENVEMSPSEFEHSRYRLIHFPLRGGTAVFRLGAVVGYFTSSFSYQRFPDDVIARLMPIYGMIQWSIAFGLVCLAVYQLVRQLGEIQHILSQTRQVNLFDLSPIYAFSRHTAIGGLWIFFIAYITNMLFSGETFNFENVVVIAQVATFSLLILSAFYLPLRGINERIAGEKERLLQEINRRLESTFERIHAAHDEEEYANMQGLHDLLMALKEEKSTIEEISAWPWKQETLTALISTLMLPIVLSLLQDLIARILGL